ncbi:MAG: SnoaL-like polyketide cyclase [Fischerella sp.]|nr:SnoaL-like polyketide cyclase [Fischerella sp.]
MSATQSQDLPLWVQDRDKVLASFTDVEWRYGKPPDYTLSDENLAKESICKHVEGSLEAIVQNLVRTFDIEANFKVNPQQWVSVVQDKFRMSTNGGPDYELSKLVESGTYKLLIGDTQHYKASEENFQTSTNLFHTAFPNGFLWEVLEVFSSPPTIAFKWRHWGHFNGLYKDYTPTGEIVEIIGMSVVRVTDDLKILSLEHYFDNTKFLAKLTAGGKQGNSERKRTSFWGTFKRLWSGGKKQQTNEQQATGCPFKKIFVPSTSR